MIQTPPNRKLLCTLWATQCNADMVCSWELHSSHIYWIHVNTVSQKQITFEIWGLEQKKIVFYFLRPTQSWTLSYLTSYFSNIRKDTTMKFNLTSRWSYQILSYKLNDFGLIVFLGTAVFCLFSYIFKHNSRIT